MTQPRFKYRHDQLSYPDWPDGELVVVYRYFPSVPAVGDSPSDPAEFEIDRVYRAEDPLMINIVGHLTDEQFRAIAKYVAETVED